jgi:hypothetical protein
MKEVESTRQQAETLGERGESNDSNGLYVW